MGNLAGFVSPFMMGSTTAGLYVLAGSLFLGGILVLLATRGQHRPAALAIRPART